MAKQLTEIEKAEMLRVLKDKGIVGIHVALREHFAAEDRELAPTDDEEEIARLLVNGRADEHFIIDASGCVSLRKDIAKALQAHARATANQQLTGVCFDMPSVVPSMEMYDMISMSVRERQTALMAGKPLPIKRDK